MTDSDCNEGLRLTVSVVSHGQGKLIRNLLLDLQNYCCEYDEVIVTLNIDEPMALDGLSFQCPVRIVRNKVPLGFGANHNQAFSLSRGKFFCVVNPDIRLFQDPFPELLSQMKPQVGIVAPKVVNSKGQIEKSARSFPTPLAIMKKALLGEKNLSQEITGSPDWVAGMFMVFPSRVFRELNGFDERYFLYYEDVDICARLNLAGYRVQLCSEVTVEHDAQCSSHFDSAYRKLHLKSMIRYFFSLSFLKLQTRRLITKLKEEMSFSE